jgi:hypothetical protein
LNANLPVTLTADVEDASIERLTLDDVEGEVQVELTPAAGREYDGITWGGEDVEFEHLDGGGIRFVVSSSGTYEVVTSVDIETPGLAPSGVNLNVFPNPFADRVRFRYNIPQSGRVTVRVFDSLGRLIASPVDAVHPAGRYENEWNAMTLSGGHAPSGVYVFEIRTKTAVSHTTAALSR